MARRIVVEAMREEHMALVRILYDQRAAPRAVPKESSIELERKGIKMPTGFDPTKPFPYRELSNEQYALLLKRGWTLAQIGDQMVMVPPAMRSPEWVQSLLPTGFNPKKPYRVDQLPPEVVALLLESGWQRQGDWLVLERRGITWPPSAGIDLQKALIIYTAEEIAVLVNDLGWTCDYEAGMFLPPGEAPRRLPQHLPNYIWIGAEYERYMRESAPANWRMHFQPLLEELTNEVGEGISTMFGVRWNLDQIQAMEWFQTYMMTFADPITSATYESLQNLIGTAMKQGWSIDVMSQRLSSLYGKWLGDKNLSPIDKLWIDKRSSLYRRELIARDQVMRASNAGAYNICAENGIRWKEWLATGDERTRPAHMLAWETYSTGGTIGPIPMDQPFILRDDAGAYQVMFPGDPSLGAPLHQIIQCRCVMLPAFPETVAEAITRDIEERRARAEEGAAVI